jgi:hypothetical protein
LTLVMALNGHFSARCGGNRHENGSMRTVTRLLTALLRGGAVRVTAVPPHDPGHRNLDRAGPA